MEFQHKRHYVRSDEFCPYVLRRRVVVPLGSIDACDVVVGTAAMTVAVVVRWRCCRSVGVAARLPCRSGPFAAAVTAVRRWGWTN